MKRFSDFAKNSNAITGEKVKIDDVIGKEIVVTQYKISDSKYKVGTKLLTLQFTLNTEERIVFTGSNVLIEQIEKYKTEIPFIATIKKVDKFYTFS